MSSTSAMSSSATGAVNPQNVNPLDCSDITAACPVEASIYGYYPNLGANSFFAALFGICLIANLYLGIRYRTWTYLVAMGLACFASTLGYAGRIILHSNPFDNTGFEIQICCLTLSPAFNSAAIYLMLKHIVKRFGREWSRLRPKYYTWGFITADLLALILQGAGGGLAATSDGNDTQLHLGENLMISGIAWQVLTLLIFGAMISDYAIRRYRSTTPLSPEAAVTRNDKKFQAFAGSLLVVYFAVLIRCVYRIAEMSGGWRNDIMQDENLFIALDSMLVALATILQTLLHPGRCFPQIAENNNLAPEEKNGSDSSVEQKV